MISTLLLLAGVAWAAEPWVEVRLPGQTPSKLWLDYPASAEEPPRPVVFHDGEQRRHDLLVHVERHGEGLLFQLEVRALMAGEPVRFFRGEELVAVTPGETKVMSVSLEEVVAPGTREGDNTRIRRQRKLERERLKDLEKDPDSLPSELVVAVGLTEGGAVADSPGLGVARGMFAWPGESTYSFSFGMSEYKIHDHAVLQCGEGLNAGVVSGRARVVWTGSHQPGEWGSIACETGEEAGESVVIPVAFY